MIKVGLRNQNRIIILEATGKPPIRGRTSISLYFHTPIELLLSSIGLCVGGTILEYCRLNDINTAIFEKIVATKDGNKYYLYVSSPENFDLIHKSRMTTQISNCAIAKELINPITIIWNINSIPTEELLKELPTKCCGA